MGTRQCRTGKASYLARSFDGLAPRAAYHSRQHPQPPLDCGRVLDCLYADLAAVALATAASGSISYSALSWRRIVPLSMRWQTR